MQLGSALPASAPCAPCSSLCVINVVKGLPGSLYCSKCCAAPTAGRLRLVPGAAHARTCWRAPSGCVHRGMGAEELAHSSVYPVFIGESLLGEGGTTDVDILDILLRRRPTSRRVTSLNFFVDGSLPQEHIREVKAFARLLSKGYRSPSFPIGSRRFCQGPLQEADGPRVASASCPVRSHLTPAPEVQGLSLSAGGCDCSGPLSREEAANCLSSTPSDSRASDCSHEKTQPPSLSPAGTDCIPVRLWFVSGELGEGLKCRQAANEVQDALLFGDPSYSASAHFVYPASSPEDDDSAYEWQCQQNSVCAGVDRGAVVFAAGGGSLCDLVGYVAATALRGLDCVLMPTTLLAAVDASVGGKNGVDAGPAKNAVGTFAHPLAVLVHLPFFRTLPPRHFANGMAEVIKIAATSSSTLFEFLCNIDPACLLQPGGGEQYSQPASSGGPDPYSGKATPHCGTAATNRTPHSIPASGAATCPLDVMADGELCSAFPLAAAIARTGSPLLAVVASAVELKAQIVGQDFREEGKRQILNFGHTIGHGLEMLYKDRRWRNGASADSIYNA